MSQFFSQTQEAKQQAPKAEKAGFDIPELVKTIAEAREEPPEQKRNGGTDMLGLLGEIRKDTSPAAQLGRLQNCRSVTIPPTPKLLLPQSELAKSAAAEMYRSLRTRVLQAQSKAGMRSFCITSAVPNEGKTLTSMNFGLCCTQISTLQVLLVDADLRTGGLSTLMGSPSGPGLAEVLSGNARFEEAVAVSDIPNLYLLPAGKPEAPAPELFSGSQWKEFIGWATECFKVVVIDTPPVLSLTDLELIAAPCDAIIMVLRALRTARKTLEQAMERIEKQKLLGTIFNASHAVNRSGSYYYYYYGQDRDPRKHKGGHKLWSNSKHEEPSKG